MNEAKWPEIKTDRNPDSPWYGTITIDAGYYGLVDRDRIAWAVELITDRKIAERIQKHRAVINDIVAAHGGRARLSIVFDENTITVTEYDWNKWTETRSI